MSVTNTTEKYNLESLLNGLSSDMARVHLIIDLYGENSHVFKGNENLVINIINRNQREQNFDFNEEVSKLYNESKSKLKRSKVVDTLTEIGNSLILPIIVEKKDFFDSAANIADYLKITRENMNLYQGYQIPYISAKIMERMGDFEEAIRLYEKGKNYQEAAKIAERIGDFEEAIRLYEKGKFFRSAEIARKNGKLEKAIELHEKFEQFDEAAEIIGEFEMRGEAIKFYERLVKHYEKTYGKNFGFNFDLEVADTVEKAGLTSQAREIRERVLEELIKSGEYKYREVEISEKLGLKEKAKKTLEEALIEAERKGFYESAIRIADELDLPEKSKEFKIRLIKKYEDEGEFYDATSYAKQFGMKEIARKSYEEIIKRYENENCLTLAIDEAEEAGFLEEIKRLSIKAYKQEIETESFSLAANYARKAGMLDKARDLYGKAIEEESKKYGGGHSSHLMIEFAEVLEESLMYDQARGLYRQLIRDGEKGKNLERAIIASEKLRASDKTKELRMRQIEQCESLGNFEAAYKIAREINEEGKIRIYNQINELFLENYFE